MAATYDVVVVGSGHNALVASSYLAKAGRKVLVLERNDYFGGGVSTKEVAAPGFKHDIHSAEHIFIQANPLLRNDELGLKSKYGLKYIHPEGVFSTIFEDHSYVISYTDVDRTCESFAKISPRDAKAYREFARRSLEIVPLVIEGLFVPPPPMGAFVGFLDQSAMGRSLFQTMQRSILDLVDEYFENEKIKIHFLRVCAELFVGPDEKGLGTILFNFPGVLHSFKPGVPVGGSAALVDALIACLKEKGAEFRANAEVSKVTVVNGRATGVQLKNGEVIQAKDCVIGQIHPWLLADVVDGLDEQVVANAKRTNTAAFACVSGHYAFKEPPKYIAGDEPGACMLTGFAPSSLMEYRRTFDAYRDGSTSKVRTLSAHTMSQFDPSRAPAGGAATTTWRLAPFRLTNETWEAAKQREAAETLEMLRYYAPNLKGDCLVGEAFHTPDDHVSHSPSFQRGDVNGIGKYFYQLSGHRPTPELSQYAVPGAEGLYLCGVFMHPPGGVTGGGRATAVKICGDLGIDFDTVTK